jgi:hypothetical protein
VNGMSVTRAIRFRNANSPCPVCGGHDRNERESGKRCGGFISEDGKYVHCTNGDYAGVLERGRAGTFAHYLAGPCRCGVEHRLAVAATPSLQAHRELVATYSYQDEAGNLLFQVLRYNPKGFSQRRPDGKGGWLYQLEGVRRVLYRLPELAAAPVDRPVYLVEGEKDVDRLAELGLVSTTNPMGAGKWREEYAGVLAGRQVVLLPDNDEAGQEHTRQVCQSLSGKAASLKIVNLPGLAPKGDVSDWLDLGHTATELEKLAAQTPYEKPPPPKRLWHADELEQFPRPAWLIEPELMRGTLSVLVGEPGSGKTFLALHNALKVAEKETVVFVAGEGAGGLDRRIKAWRKQYKPAACHFSGSLLSLCSLKNLRF